MGLQMGLVLCNAKRLLGFIRLADERLLMSPLDGGGIFLLCRKTQNLGIPHVGRNP